MSDHASRKRNGWEEAFSTRSLEDYEGSIKSKINASISEISKEEGKVIDLGMITSWLGFDIIGLLGFSKSFEAKTAKPIEVSLRAG